MSALQEYNAAFTSAKHRLDGDEIQMLQAFAVSAKAVWVLQAVRELKAANRGKVIRNPKNYLLAYLVTGLQMVCQMTIKLHSSCWMIFTDRRA